MSGAVEDNQENQTVQTVQTVQTDRGVLFLNDVVGDDGRLRQREGFERVFMTPDQIYQLTPLENKSTFAKIATAKAKYTSPMDNAKIDVGRTPFYFRGSNQSFSGIFACEGTQDVKFGEFLVKQKPAIDIKMTEAEAQALFTFAVLNVGASSQVFSSEQGGQYVVLHKLLLMFFLGDETREHFSSCLTAEERHADLFLNAVSAPSYLVNRNSDDSLMLSVFGSFGVMGDGRKVPLLDYQCDFLVKTQDDQVTCTLTNVQIFADKKRGFKQKIDALVLKDSNDLPTIRNVIHGKKRQATHWLDRFFGGLFGAIFGFLFAPVISLSMAIEHFDQHFANKGLVPSLLTLLLYIIWSVTLAPLQGLYYGLISCPDTGTLSAFSPKAHFKNWLAYQLYICENPETRAKDRQNLLDTHGRHNFVYTLVALTLLLSLGSFAIVASSLMPLPFFVSTALGLMLTPIAPWLLGLAVMLPILVVGGIAILAYTGYQAYSDKKALAKVTQPLETGQEPNLVAADQLPSDGSSPHISRESSQNESFHSPESSSPEYDTPSATTPTHSDHSDSDSAQ